MYLEYIYPALGASLACSPWLGECSKPSRSVPNGKKCQLCLETMGEEYPQLHLTWETRELVSTGDGDNRAFSAAGHKKTPSLAETGFPRPFLKFSLVLKEKLLSFNASM